MNRPCTVLALIVGAALVGCSKSPTGVEHKSAPESSLTISTSEIHFNIDYRSEVVTIENSGSATVAFQAYPEDDWILLENGSGLIESGATYEVTVRLLNRAANPAGDVTSIYFETPAETYTIEAYFHGGRGDRPDQLLFSESWDGGWERWHVRDRVRGSGLDYWGPETIGRGDRVADAAQVGRAETNPGGYDNDMDARLELNAADAVNILGYENLQISFDLRMESADGDELALEVLRGERWTQAHSAWSGGDWEWQRVVVELDERSVRGLSTLRFRFRVRTDESGAEGKGFQIDDVRVHGSSLSQR